jgi:hypothetical protein
MRKHTIDTEIAELALRQGGVFTAHQASKVGAGEAVRRRRRESGSWVRLGGCVYRLRDHPVTWHGRLWAALLDAGGPIAVVSHRSAARLLGLPGRWGEVVEITKKRGWHHDVTLGRLHETSWLPPEHVVTVDGLACTTVARTVFDLAGDPEPWERGSPRGLAIHELRVRRLMNACLGRHGLTIEQQAAVLAALGKRGRPGSALVRALLTEFGPDHTPTESGLEDLFLSVVTAAGLEPPEKQVNVGTDHFIGRVDFVYREARLIIEVDSRWHDGPDDRERDRWRDNELHAAGWRVIRVRYRDLVTEPDRVVRLIRRALRTSAA